MIGAHEFETLLFLVPGLRIALKILENTEIFNRDVLL